MFIVILILTFLTSCSGKDTVVEFSNPDIQIVTFYFKDRIPQKVESLFIGSSQTTVEINVYDYVEKGGNIYAVGEDGYTVLNTRTKLYKKSRTLEGFDQNDQRILSGLNLKRN